MRRRSLILRTDSYKETHWPVYPPNTEHVYSYLVSRGGKFAETVFYGLQYYLLKYLVDPVTMDDVDYAEHRARLHFGTDRVFNRLGWEHIVRKHDGYLPLRIMAPPEGLVVPARNVLMTIENTDPLCYFATNYVESLLLKVWYPITVATLSREIKKVINRYLVMNGDPAGLPFKLHDFGYRGVSSEESAEIGGAAHLVNFLGTDNILSLEFLTDYYGEEMAGFSIPATEHSVMSAMGETGELSMMERFLDTFGEGPYPAIACVSDTYDVFRACRQYWGNDLKAKVENVKGILVVRPDSGELPTTVVQVVETLNEAFGHTVNEKGFKVLNRVRVIQGDGVDLEPIEVILESLHVRGWSADNIAFGMGGALLQKLNRDTNRFAIKASSYVIDGVRYDYNKNPVTDPGKRSKAGRFKLVEQDGVLTTVQEEDPGENLLQIAYINGILPQYYGLSGIRELARLR